MSQDYVVDVYLSVRLEAGSLHFVNYLICATFYYLDQKVTLFLHLQNAVVPQTEKPPASRCHSSSSSNGFRLCKNGLQGSGIHFLSSQIFPRSSRKRFDKMSFGATKMHRRWRCIFDLRPKRNPAPSGAAFFYPRRYAAAPRGSRGKTPGPPPVGFASEDLYLSRAPLCCQVTDRQCDSPLEVHLEVHHSSTKCLRTNTITSQRCTAGQLERKAKAWLEVHFVEGKT